MFNHDLILGILGGGQLEKMSAMSAAELGIKVIIYTDEQDAPASQVAYKTINGALDDLEALEQFISKNFSCFHWPNCMRA